MNKFNLIIVDAQYDFAHKDGALYVPGAEKAIQEIIKFIDEHKTEIDKVVFTMDNHPSNHCSFKENGGIWPTHCVQNTDGQKVISELINVCNNNNINYSFLKKGEKSDTEEYTAFSKSCWINDKFVLESLTDAEPVHTNKFVVCGFAGDYCVKDSIKDLIKFIDKDNVKIFRNGIADIDDGTTLNNFIKENNLVVINS